MEVLPPFIACSPEYRERMINLESTDPIRFSYPKEPAHAG